MLRADLAQLPSNYSESLSGIETKKSEFPSELTQLPITLNPYQGLKPMEMAF